MALDRGFRRGYVRGGGRGRGGRESDPREETPEDIAREKTEGPADLSTQADDAVCSIALRLGHTTRVLLNVWETSVHTGTQDEYEAIHNGLKTAADILMNLWREQYKVEYDPTKE